MPTRRTMLFIAASTLGMPRVVVVAPAVAADASATAFVTRIYDVYKSENSKGILIDTDAAIRRYFEPSLAALISKDEAITPLVPGKRESGPPERWERVYGLAIDPLSSKWREKLNASQEQFRRLSETRTR